VRLFKSISLCTTSAEFAQDTKTTNYKLYPDGFPFSLFLNTRCFFNILREHKRDSQQKMLVVEKQKSVDCGEKQKDKKHYMKKYI